MERVLSKRTRELGCLYNLLTVFEAPDLDLEEVCQGILERLTTGWQYPQRTCARLVLEGRTWQTPNFRATPWLLSEPIVLHGQPAGSLEVGYLEERPAADEGPFLVEERVLLEVVAGRLSRFIERRRYGQELRRQRDLAQGLVQTAQAIVLVLDQEGRIVYFNPFLEKLTGYRLAEVRGHDWTEVFLPPDLDEELRAHFRPGQDQAQRQPHLVPIRDSRGNLSQVEWRNRTLQRKDGSPDQEVLCTGQDLTRRLELEAEHYRLAAVVEQSVDAIALTDPRGVMIYVNPAYEALHGRGRQEFLGQEAPLLAQARANQNFFRQMWADLAAGRSWSGRYGIARGNGQEFEVETVISPIRDHSGAIINYYAHHRDITQEQKLRDHLRQAHKMEAIGTLAGGIAHDFNNILGGISGYVELARMFLEDQARAADYLAQALKAGDRAKDLVRQILTFSRQAEQQKKPLDLASEVREALRLMRATLPSTIEITQDLAAPPATVLADPTQIQQVILNLCTNAAHAMRQRGGHLEVSLHLVHMDAREVDNYPGLSAGPHLRLCVSDTGHGMPREVVERIFEPFFTTKAQGEGTGLGLAVVHGIVSSSQGIIKVYSQPGKGTAFHVLLPCQEYGPAAEDHQDQETPGGHERILVVDDEETLVEIQRNLLGSLGYQVSAFVCSLEALKHFKENPGQFDLVLTDLTMPNLTGLDLAQALLELAPGLPVILCTGFSESSALETARSLGVREVILKPVLRGDLARAVRRHLDTCTKNSPAQEGGRL
ncbi:MAG: PAS domain S-box protein [Desulfarculus sp.]|nr:PAS domain S-box protein [Desulfarculus sp.]